MHHLTLSHRNEMSQSNEQIRTMGSGAMTGSQVIAASLIAMRSHSSQKSLMDQQPLVPWRLQTGGAVPEAKVGLIALACCCDGTSMHETRRFLGVDSCAQCSVSRYEFPRGDFSMTESIKILESAELGLWVLEDEAWAGAAAETVEAVPVLRLPSSSQKPSGTFAIAAFSSLLHENVRCLL